MKKNSSWRKIFVIIMALITVLSIAMPALAADGFAWGGRHKDGDSASSVATGGYSIMYGTAGKCVLGYRFSVVNKDGKPIGLSATQDVYFKESNITSRYRGLQVSNYKPMSRPVYYYEDEMADEDAYWEKAEVKTYQKSDYAQAESACSFATSLPRGDVDYAYEMATWGANAVNAQKLCTLLGTTYSTVKDKEYTITVEPIFGFTLNNLPVAWTVADIGAWGKVYFSGGTTPASKGDSGATYGFIANYTNRHFANLLYVDELKYLGNWSSAATALTSRTSFNNLYYKAYGTGVLIANGVTPPIPETKGYTLTLIGDEGVESFASASGTYEGNGKYTGFSNGDKPSCTVKLKDGYRLVEIYGTGYNGSGTWYESSDGKLPATGSYTTDFTMRADRTLTAVTEKIDTSHTLTVIGDKGIANITGAGTYSHGATATVTVTAKPGYVLSYYYGTTYDGSDYDTWTSVAGKTYDSDTWSMYADRTLYVYSKPIDYTLTYDANGGSVNPSSTTFTYSGKFNSLAVPTRTGYTFNRWYAEFNGSNYINLGRDYMYTDKLSLHLEAYMDDWSTYCTKDMRLISCTEGGGWNIESSNNNKVAFAIYDAGEGYKSVTTSKTWASLGSGWHTFDLVFDGSYAYCYVDGELVGTSAKFVSGQIGYHASNTIYLGAEAGNNTSKPDGNYFTGCIANLSITNSSTRTTSTASQFMKPAQDFTLKAEWTPNYTVVYKPNGASGNDWSDVVTPGSNYTVEENWYTRPGYTFTGWSTSPSGDDGYGWTGWSGTWNFVNGQYGISDYTLTLYAQWTPDKYTVVYKPNGASGNDWSNTATTGSQYTVEENWYTRPGYTFTGWSTSPSGDDGYGWTDWSGTWNFVNGQYGISDYTLTLYAQWKINSYGYTVNHYLQNLDGTTYTLESSVTGTATFGSKVTGVLKSYTGFNTPSAQTITIGTSGNVINYYYTRNKYTVTLNKGTGINSVSGAGSYYYGESVTINADVLTGYAWSKWTGTHSTTTQKYTFTMPAANVTDTANATAIGYTITYDPNGGALAGSATQSYNITTNVTLQAAPTRAGYTFAGWKLATATGNWAAGTYAASKNIGTGKYGNITLVAQWTVNSYGYTVNHYLMNLDGKTYTLESSVTGTATFGSKVTGTVKSFTGFTSPSAQTITIGTSSNVINYYYTRNKYTVTLNKGTGINSVSGAGSYYYGESVTINADVLTGYAWSKWTGTHSTTTQKYTFTMPAANVTDTANATANGYIITYDPNGGSLAGSATQGYNSTTNVTLQAAPSRTGYTFTGWKLATATGNWAAGTYEAGKNVGTGKYGNITLVAQWTVNSYGYTVNHYLMNLDGKTYTLESSVTGTATFGSKVTGALKSYTGFTAPSAQSITIGTGSNVINYYYTRNKYPVTLNKGTGINSVSGAGSYYYGETVTINAETLPGYAWNKWTGTHNTTTQKYTFTMPAASVTDTANATANGYTITYDPNGGSLAGSATQSYNATTNVTLQAAPTRTGYTFAGWKLATATGNWTAGTYEAGKNIGTGKYGNITLVAQWTPITYQVIYTDGFNLMRGLEDVGNTAADRMTYSISNGVVTVTAKENDGYGYTTGRVYLEAGKTYYFTCKTNGTWTGQTEAFLMLNGGLSAYYHMASKDGYAFTPTVTGTYWLRLDVNTAGETYKFWDISVVEGKTSPNVTGYTATSTHTYGVAKNLTANGFSRTGYTFNKWNTKADGTGTSYANGASVINLTATNGGVVVLYAQWTPINYTITYDPNGGTLAGNANQSYNITTNVTLQAAPTRTGYTFAGWKLATATGNWTAGNYAASKNVGTGKYGNITLVAQWNANTSTKYTVNHWTQTITAAQNDSVAQNSTNYTLYKTESLTGTTGSKVTPAVLTITGFTAPAKQTVTIAADGSTVVNYYYTRNKYYLDLNGWLDSVSAPNIDGYGTADIYVNGSLVADDVTDYWTAWPYGSTYEIKDIKSTTGHTYNGVHSGSLSGTIAAETTTVVLDFTTNKVQIAYNPNGGTVSVSGYGYNQYGWITQNSVTYFHEISYGNSDDPYNASSFGLTRPGYTFGGWSMAPNGTVLDQDTIYSSTTYVDQSDASKTTANTSVVHCYLYAIWNPISYTITYEPNGGTLVGGSTQTYDPTTSVTLQGAPTRPGYTFAGWKLAETTGNWYAGSYSAGKVVGKGKYGNITLVAQWASDTIKITLDKKGGTGGLDCFYFKYGINKYYSDADCTKEITSVALPSKTGYTFLRYYGDGTSGGSNGETYIDMANDGTGSIASDLCTDIYKDATLYAEWMLNQYNYTVNYYLQNIGGNGYTLNSSINGTADFGAKITGTVKSFTGFTSPTAQSITISADETKNVINYYYTRNQYTVTVNKGTGISSATGAGKYWYGEQVTIDADASTGYSWSKWSGYVSTTDKKYSFTMPAKNVSVTANATPIDYTITYDPNGGSLVGDKTQGYIITTDITLQKAPTRTGYTFAGWKLATATGNWTAGTYEAGKNVGTGKYGNITLVAQWTVNSYKYTVNHYLMNLDGKTYTLDSSVTGTAAFGSKVTGALKSYTGFTAPSAQTITISTDETKNVINYYYTRNKYTVTLINGTGISSVSGAGSYYYGESVTINAETLPGYAWSKWTGTHNTTTQKYTFTMPAANVTDTANATAIGYTITYDPNGGTLAGSATQSYNITTNVTLQAAPTRAGYTFAGWKLATATGNWTAGTYEAGKNIGTGKYGNITLVAQWTPNGYTITYDPNGGSLAGSATQSYNPTTNVTLQAAPTRTGYTFAGWKLSTATGNWTAGTYEASKNVGTGKYGNITLVAQWTPIQYTVVYKPNGAPGSDWSNTTTTGSKYTVKSNWYTRTGYIFAGWSTDPSGDDGYGWTDWSGTWNYVNGQYGISNNTLTLYAQWKPIQYTIHYDGNGATSGSTPDSKHTYDVEQGLTPNGFTKPGYVPDGWNTKPDGSGTSFKDKEIVKNLTDKDGDTITVYIQWKPITYNIQYVLNGGTHGTSHPNSATYDQAFTVSNPTRGQGYVFTGWTITGMDGTTHYIGSSTTNSTSVSSIMDTVFKNLRITEGTVTFTANWYSYDVELVDISFKYVDGSGNIQTVTDMNNMVYGTKYYVFYTYRNNSTAAVTADCYGSGKKLLETRTFAAGESVTIHGGSFTPGIGDGILSGYIYLNGCSFGDTSGETNGNNNTKTVSFKTKFDIELKEIYLADANGNRLDPTQILTNQKVYIHHVYKNNSGGSVSVNGYHQNNAITVNGSYAFTLDANATKDVVVKIHTPTKSETTTITGAVWRNGKSATTEYFETNLSNNTKSLAITVLDIPYLEPIRPNQGYRQGTDVITSYYVHNDTDIAFDPSKPIVVTMYVYNRDSGELVTSQTQTTYVPANEKQLIWFKWSVPADFKTGFRIKATITANGVEGVLVDKNYSLALDEEKNTADTEFEKAPPSWWSYNSPDSDYGTTSRWSVWEWENGSFVQKNYGLYFTSGSATITPFRSPTAVLKDGVWVIRSGYGFTLSMDSATAVASTGGYLLPNSNAYTMPQYVYARYPEFQYKAIAFDGACGETTMEKVGSTWQLPDYLDYNGRCHFTPLWYPDGNYTVTVISDDIWTPMGCYHIQTSATLKISGSVYDDWSIA